MKTHRALAFVLLLLATDLHAAKLAPMPKTLEQLAEKVGSLWRGNRALYCDPQRGVTETVREVKLLKEVKVARYDAKRQELQFETRSGTKGALDIDPKAQLAARAGEICIRD